MTVIRRIIFAIFRKRGPVTLKDRLWIGVLK